MNQENAHTTRWYVLRAYKNELRAKEQLEKLEIPHFIPMRYALRERHGRKLRCLVPVISSLVFVRTSRSVLLAAKKHSPFLQFVTHELDGVTQYLIVPDQQMEAFIRMASSLEQKLTYYHPEELNISNGVRVRIHGGAFSGIEAIFVQLKGKRKRHVVVLLDNLLGISAEIDPDYIEVIE